MLKMSFVCISNIHCMPDSVLFSHYALCVLDWNAKFYPEKMWGFLGFFPQAKFDRISCIMETLLNVLPQQSVRISVELLALAGVNI